MNQIDEAWYEAKVAEFKAPLDRDYPDSPETNRFLAERRVEAIIENGDEVGLETANADDQIPTDICLDASPEAQ